MNIYLYVTFYINTRRVDMVKFNTVFKTYKSIRRLYQILGK